ncbi:MAG: hypothetical protein IT215_06500 [Chitinophagaceae bacterium]|nr:hypothetical protein [Chitinophagaceae bacterium]
MEAQLAAFQSNPLFFTILIVVTIWELSWKGVALWKAGRLSHKWWFISIMFFNTLGILPIIYIFFVAKNWKVEINQG